MKIEVTVEIVERATVTVEAKGYASAREKAVREVKRGAEYKAKSRTVRAGACSITNEEEAQ